MKCPVVHGIAVKQISNFFFPFEMLFTDFHPSILSAVLAVQKGFSAPAYLPSPQFPEIPVDIFMSVGITGMLWQANGGSTQVIFTGWSILFLLVGIYKALPQ